MSTSLPRRFRRVVAATAATALTAGTLALVATPAQAATPAASAVSESAAAASVTVSRTALPASGEHRITVRGTGFTPSLAIAGRPPLAGKPAGSYVIFGKFAEKWQPTLDAPADGRKVIDQKWAVSAADMATIGGPGRGAAELRPDGTFTTTLTISKAAADAVVLDGGRVGVYTYAGGGAKQALYETYTPITFTEAVDNDAPSAADVSVTTPFGTAATISLPGADADDDPLTFTTTAPERGTAAVDGSKVTYTPAAGFSGTDAFTYTATDDFGGSATGTVTVTVSKEPAVASTTTLSAPAKLTYGRTGTATATVKASKALSGSIQLLDGAKVIGTRPVGAGTASFALPKNLTVGTHRLSARFVSGNAPVVTSSSSAARTLSIAKVTTKTAVKVTKKPTRKKAGKATVTVSGTPKAKGKVTLVIKGKGIKKTVRGTVKNGKVVVKLPKLKKKGTYKVTATFAATGTHKGSKKTVKVKVTK